MVLQLLRRVRQEQEAIGARPKPQEAVPAAAKGTRRMTENIRIGMAIPERDPRERQAASLAEQRGVLGRKAAVCDHRRQAPLARAQGPSSRRVATPNDSIYKGAATFSRQPCLLCTNSQLDIRTGGIGGSCVD